MLIMDARVKPGHDKRGQARADISLVMAGLVPAIHALGCKLSCKEKAWMPAQTSLRSLRKLDCERGHDERKTTDP
jgi:hypothetical protein